MSNENHQGSEFEPFTLTLEDFIPPVSENISAKLASLKGKKVSFSITISSSSLSEEEKIVAKIEATIKKCRDNGVNIKVISKELLS